MSKSLAARCLVPAFAALLFATPALAQYSAITTPMHNINDSFFENMGVGFGFNIPGAGFRPGDDRGPSGTFGLNPLGQPTANGSLPFTQGGGVRPPFGGGGGAIGGGGRFGFGTAGGGLNTFSNIGMSQGTSRSMVMESPTVVVPNGGQGTIIDATQRPFVTGMIPVVGGYGPGPGYGMPASPPVSPLFERIQRLNAQGGFRPRSDRQAVAVNDSDLAVGGGGSSRGQSTAESGDLSVAEIRRRQATQGAAADEELSGWIERARGAEAAGKRNVAKIYYRMAAARATGELKQQLAAKYREMEGN